MTLAEWLLLFVAGVGVAGTVLPLLPGAWLILIASVVYAWWSQWQIIGVLDLIVLTGLALLSQGADLLLGAEGARRGGAGKAGMVGAGIGALIGVFALGPIGIFVGPIGGALLAEAIYGKPLAEAFRAGVWAGVGALAATVFRLFIGFLMFAYLLWQVAFGS